MSATRTISSTYEGSYIFAYYPHVHRQRCATDHNEFVTTLTTAWDPMTAPPTGLIPISLATLQPIEEAGMDLYFKPGDGDKPILFCAHHEPIRSVDLNKLENSGITKLYINRDARAQYQTYLRENLDEWLSDEEVPLERRAGALNEVVRDVLSESFRRQEVSRIVDDAQALGQKAAQLMSGEPIMAGELMKILHHDYATFTHSANVSYYATMLGRALGMAGDELVQIAAGGLLHDLGKLEIDEKILTKPGRLDDIEFQVIKRHPLTGFRKLCRRTDLNAGQLMMVYQHHERCDGKGYPVGCESAEIHPWAKLCSVVDVFEALTSQRPYRTPLANDVAIQVLEKDRGTAFDSEILECWKKLILANSSG